MLFTLFRWTHLASGHRCVLGLVIFISNLSNTTCKCLYLVLHLSLIITNDQACEKTCYQKHLIANCRCGDPQYPTEGQALGTGQADVCDIRNNQQGENFSIL